MSLGERYVRAVTRRSKLVVAVVLVASLVLGVGAAGVEQSSSLDQFETESEAAETLEYVQAAYEPEDGTTTVQIVVRGENVLDRESLVATLELQRTFLADEEIEPTLVEDEPVADLASVVATTAMNQQAGGEPAGGDGAGAPAPSLEDQIAQRESMSDEEVESVVASVLDDGGDVLTFLPTDYEPGTTESDARMVFVTQQTDAPGAMEGEAPADLVDSQLAMADHVDERFDAGIVFGAGIVTDEIDRSLVDSLTIVLPLALLFVSIVLAVAYRDLLDIVVGLAGVVLVLVWTFGFLGWAGIDFNQLMIAVPVLLVGLSVDYAIHLFMRHREARADDAAPGDDPGSRAEVADGGTDPREDGTNGHGGGTNEPDGGETNGHGGDSTRSAMTYVVAGLGVAFVWVTATAVIGFLSNLISPIGPIQEFGVASAFGIASALVIFGALVPATKVELDALFESRGYDRRKRAFGTGGGRLTGVLSTGQRAAKRAPWAVVALALLLTLGGVAGAVAVDTSFEQEDFIADDPPAWMKSLPGPLAAGDYDFKDNMAFVNDRFLREDAQAQLVVEGSITDDGALERVDAIESATAETDVVARLADGQANLRSPLTAMEAVAAENESFADTFEAADTTGDGVPDEDVEGVYDAFFEVAPEQAADVIHRTDAGYQSLRVVVSIQGDAQGGDVTNQLEGVADEPGTGDGIETTATGQLIVYHLIEQELFDTVIQSMLIALAAVVAFLMIAYRFVHGSATLGAITLSPIVFGVAWILGTMYVLGISFNVMTGTITSLTIGLGVAYNIHMSERFVLERKRGRSTDDALYRAVTGTGGALTGSAATTVGGFGVLVFAILPPLQQFGLITGLTITYAFLGSVFVLPSMLALWARHLAPADEGQKTTADRNHDR